MSWIVALLISSRVPLGILVPLVPLILVFYGGWMLINPNTLIGNPAKGMKLSSLVVGLVQRLPGGMGKLAVRGIGFCLVALALAIVDGATMGYVTQRQWYSNGVARAAASLFSSGDSRERPSERTLDDYTEAVLNATNMIAEHGLRAEETSQGRIRVTDAAGKEIMRMDLIKFFNGHVRPGEIANAIMESLDWHVAIWKEKYTLTEPSPSPTESPSPSPTDTPSPTPTKDPRLAEIDRLMAKAAAQWQAGKREASLMLAEEALKDAEAHLPAGDPKIDEVRNQVEAARAAIRNQ